MVALMLAVEPVVQTWNPTRICGTVLFALTSVICLHAARVHSQARRVGLPTANPQLWTVLGIAFTLFLLEVQVQGRFWVGNQLRALLRSESLYESRHTIQIALLAIVAGPILALCVWLCYRLRRFGRSAMAGVAGTLFCCLLMAMPLASPHAYDRIVYHHHVGPFMVIALLWTIGAATTAAAAVASARWANQYIPRRRRR